MNRKKVLVAALNWGLGHATRCIPVIRAFERRGCDVAFASDGASLLLLKKEFPHLKAFELPPYGVVYWKKLPMTIGIALQLPKVLRNIKKERVFMRTLQETERFEVIVDYKGTRRQRLAPLRSVVLLRHTHGRSRPMPICAQQADSPSVAGASFSIVIRRRNPTPIGAKDS